MSERAHTPPPDPSQGPAQRRPGTKGLALGLSQSKCPETLAEQRPEAGAAWQAGPSGAQLRHTVKQRSRHLGGKKSLAVCRGPSGLATIPVNPKTELGNCPELLSLAAGSGYGAQSPPRVVPVLAGSRGGTSPCGNLRGGTARLQRRVPPATSQPALGTEMLPSGRLCP